MKQYQIPKAKLVLFADEIIATSAGGAFESAAFANNISKDEESTFSAAGWDFSSLLK